MKLKLTFGLAALLVAGLASCSKDEGNQNKERDLQITLTAAAAEYLEANGTRTNISTGIGLWDAGPEVIGLFIDAEGITNRPLTGTTTDGGYTNNFSGALGTNLPNATYEAYAYYPYGALAQAPASNRTNVRVLLPAVQNPLKKSFDPKADIMYSNPFSLAVSGSAGTATANFNHAVAIVKVVFKGIAAATGNEPVTSFSMETGAAQYLTGNVEMNLETGALAFYSSTDRHNKVTALYESSDMVLDGTNAIYLCVAPATLTAETQLTFIAETNSFDINKLVTLEEDIALPAGVITTINVSGATVTAKESGSGEPWTGVDYTTADINAVKLRKIYFGHKSVGFDITNGIKRISDIIVRTAWPAANDQNLRNEIALLANGPRFIEHDIQNDGNPLNKITTFRRLMNDIIQSNVDIAFFKFCYMDINTSTNVSALITAYQEAVHEIRTRFPNVIIVHFTVPLYARAYSEDNHVREQISRWLRDTYKGKVFDIAAIQSVGSNGAIAMSLDNTTIAMADEWTFPTPGDGGHLNNAGGNRIAGALIAFLAQVQQ